MYIHYSWPHVPAAELYVFPTFLTRSRVVFFVVVEQKTLAGAASPQYARLTHQHTNGGHGVIASLNVRATHIHVLSISVRPRIAFIYITNTHTPKHTHTHTLTFNIYNYLADERTRDNI